MRNEFLSMVQSVEYWSRILIARNILKVFHTDSKSLYALCANEGRNPSLHRFICDCKSIYAPVRILWRSSNENISDLFSRAPKDITTILDSNRNSKKLHIFTIARDMNIVNDQVRAENQDVFNSMYNFLFSIKNLIIFQFLVSKTPKTKNDPSI